MCGIAGLWAPGTIPNEAILRQMVSALAHRGPDDDGVWLDRQAGVALGHRRLSIIDTSQSGHQPMESVCGRFTLVFNGEIYNFRDLREAIDRTRHGMAWRGHSDTEVLLAGFSLWGIHETLVRSNGMFALAVWDRLQQTLTLARDRMGEKPLYFGHVGGKLVFGSEIKAIRPAYDQLPGLDRSVALDYLRLGYVRGPRSILSGLYRLPPGTYLRLSAGQLGLVQDWASTEPLLTRYWSLADAARHGAMNPAAESPESIERLDQLLRKSVSMRMVSDVPLGAFLSGGIDSSTVVAIMQSLSSRRIKTFCIGFEDESLDEAPRARSIANHIGTDHTELYVTAADALAVIPTLASTYDEPFADSSQIPTILVSRLARQSVTVSLSGDGGDELFGGYSRYFDILRLWKMIGHYPLPARQMTAKLLAAAAPFAYFPSQAGTDSVSLSFKIQRMSLRMEARDIDAMRSRFIAGYPVSAKLHDPDPAFERHCSPSPFVGDRLRRLMYADQLDYLPDDILVKVDRASMSVSLESRIPFLDHNIVEFSWSLPSASLVQGHVGKIILRKVLSRYLPDTLTAQRKQGFGVPLATWLRGPLRAWAESLLTGDNINELGLLPEADIRDAWHSHLKGHRNFDVSLWNLLMLIAWNTDIRRQGLS